jgi:hypothetical protein
LARAILARLLRLLRSCECQKSTRHPTRLKLGTNLVRSIGIAISFSEKECVRGSRKIDRLWYCVCECDRQRFESR